MTPGEAARRLPYAKRHDRRLLWSVLATLALAAPVWFWLLRNPTRFAAAGRVGALLTGIVPMLPVFAVQWTTIVLDLRWRARMRARAAAASFRLCPDCAYDARGLAEDARGWCRCPECGAEFNPADATTAWRALADVVPPAVGLWRALRAVCRR